MYKPYCHHKSYRHNGFTILELALSIPAIIVLTLGLFDIANLLRAYGVANTASRTLARQLATVDGDGISVEPDTRERNYRWDKVRWEGELIRKRDAITLSMPEYKFPDDCSPGKLQPDEICIRRCRGYASVAGGGKRTINLRQALEKDAIGEVKAVFPNAHTDCKLTDVDSCECKGPYCVSAQRIIHTAKDSNNENFERIMEVKLGFDVPLLLGAQRVVHISSTVSQPLELPMIDRKPIVSNRACRSGNQDSCQLKIEPDL